MQRISYPAAVVLADDCAVEECAVGHLIVLPSDTLRPGAALVATQVLSMGACS